MDSRENTTDDTLAAKAADLNINEAPTTSTTDPLQVAAQTYPWIHMTSTLDACFKEAEATATKELETTSKELETEEADLAEQRTRFEAERLIKFYDEMSPDQFTKDAPKIMQSFLSHGDACSVTESEALRLATKQFDVTNEEDLEQPMVSFNDILTRLDNLQSEAESLQKSISQLIAHDPFASFEGSSESTVARATMTPLFGSCLPALKARLENLSLATLLVEGAKEQFAMDLHIASLESQEQSEEDYDSDIDHEREGKK